jgi:hypothetical protein
MDKLYPKARSHSLDAPEGPLAEHLGAFEGLLTDQGYAQESIRRKLRLVADFSVWLKRKKILIDVIAKAKNMRLDALCNCCKKMESLQETRPLRRHQLKNW